MIKSDEAVPQRVLLSDKEEKEYKDESEVVVSQVEEESSLELNKIELTCRINQEVEGQALGVVKEEEESYVET